MGNNIVELEKRKKGFILLYVFILLIPITFVCGALLNMVLMDFKTNINVSKKQQAYNNAEVGTLDALKRLPILDFGKFNHCAYYLVFEDGEVTYTTDGEVTYTADELETKDYAKVSIDAKVGIDPKEYIIKVIGSYTGYTYLTEMIYYD